MCTLEPPVSEEAFSNKGKINQFPDILINYLELSKVIKTIFSKFSRTNPWELCHSNWYRIMNFINREKPFQYPICQKPFNSSSNLCKHKLSHSTEKPFQNCDCPKAFKSTIELSVHKRGHSGEKPFRCSNCQKFFNKSQTLSRHKLSHSTEKLFQCCDCQKAFKSSKQVSEHKQRHGGKNHSNAFYVQRHLNQIGNWLDINAGILEKNHLNAVTV